MSDRLTELESGVWMLLRYGRENAQTKAALAQRAGVTAREIEHAINGLRNKREPVASAGCGYWAPRTAAEYRENIRSRRERAVRQLVTVRAERRAADDMALAEAGAATVPIWPTRAA